MSTNTQPREQLGGHVAGQTGPDSSVAIAEHLAKVNYEDLSDHVVAHTKEAIADPIACIIAGTGGEEFKAVTDLMGGWGGNRSSTVIGAGGLRIPPDNAVLANGAAVHQYDFDDTHDTAVCHPTPASFMPALALAEEKGGVSGRDLIAAVALGNDVTSRVALAITGRLNSYQWIRASIAGIFGATAAAGRILGLDSKGHLDALGLALPQAAGTLASLHNAGSSVRSIRDGLCYRSAVLAASLAARGVRGDREVFDGPYGVYHTYFRGEYDRNVLTHELGERYETVNVSLKPWPSCRHLHGTLTAVIGLLQEHKLGFDDVDHVLLHVGDVNFDRSRPVRTGLVPQNRIDLLCNLPFAVGAALRHGTLPLKLYRDGAMADDVVTKAVPKVKWIFDPEQNGPWTLEPGYVEMFTTDGRHFTSKVRRALGHPENPMSEEQRRRKMIDCCAAAAEPIGSDRANRIFDMVMSLETLDDLAPLSKALA
jgi:2-methylcitrate dehydratase PrpD